MLVAWWCPSGMGSRLCCWAAWALLSSGPPFGGGVIGNTAGSGPVVEGSSPSPRASWARVNLTNASHPAGSSRGLGRRPLKAVTGVQIPSRLLRVTPERLVSPCCVSLFRAAEHLGCIADPAQVMAMAPTARLDHVRAVGNRTRVPTALPFDDERTFDVTVGR